MIRYLAAGFKHALGLHRPGRKLPARPDDLLLASYPFSGNLWMRFLIANLLHPHQQVTSGNLHRLIVDPDVSLRRDIDRIPRPRIVRTNGTFDPRYRRVICLVRHPREVALSQFHALRQSQNPLTQISFDNFLDRFLAGNLDRFTGSWGENAASWLAARSHSPGFFLLRYEDLLADTSDQLNRMAQFAGWAATPEAVARAVDRSSTKMPESENKHGQGQRPMLSNPGQSPSSGTDLSPIQLSRIEAAWGDIIAYLGYDLVTRDPQSALNSSLLELLTTGAPVSSRERGKLYAETFNEPALARKAQQLSD